MNQNVKMGDVYRENEGKQKNCIFWFPLKPLPQAGNPKEREGKKKKEDEERGRGRGGD